MKTHKVIDVIYHDNEAGHEAYVGTYKECHDFVEEQSDFGYLVVPLTKKESEYVNMIYNESQ